MDNQSKFNLVQKALEARKAAYVPYSKYRVGAAILSSSGKIYSGCNIENASYGLTNCAERTAVFKAVSEEGPRGFKILAVAADGNTPASPCGACRQVIKEFFDDSAEVILVNEKGEGYSTTVGELLPGAFSNKYLQGGQ